MTIYTNCGFPSMTALNLCGHRGCDKCYPAPNSHTLTIPSEPPEDISKKDIIIAEQAANIEILLKLHDCF